MKRIILTCISLSICIFLAETQFVSGKERHRISYWFDAPAYSWEEESMPIGNGSIGANVFGSISTEHLTFNEKSLWRGGPNTAGGADYYWNVNKKSAHLLDEIRQAFSNGDKEKAAALTRNNFNGLAAYEPADETPFRFGNYTTAGDFLIETGIEEAAVSDYRRELSLDSALVSVSFRTGDVRYIRNYFISYPDNVLVMRFRADKPGRQTLVFRYAPNPDSFWETVPDGTDGVLCTGNLSSNNMKYAVRIKALTEGGYVYNAAGALKVKGADEVVFIVTADTDYKINFDPDFNDPLTYVGVDPEKTTREWMSAAACKGYAGLYQTHYDDYAPLFSSAGLILADENDCGSDIPVTERFANYRSGKQDKFLEELYWHFGRYLLISSSRAGNLPANLQGIWSDGVDGPWRVDYHNNINLQMNYWPACVTNLEECVPPLIDFIRTMEKSGERVARDYYDAEGWTASISGNIFGFASPLSSTSMTWNLCPIAGPWLATHVWEYYDYTRDLDFLKSTGYNLIKGSARFVSDYLWRSPDGVYTAAPSTSPEHGPIDEGATFVHAVAKELLEDAIAASEILGADRNERKKWKDVLENIAPYRIGRYGQLLEWSEDIDDPKNTHRHVNHLFGLHPGSTISPITTPELAAAAEVVLNHRGDDATGWSMGWKLNLWARLHDGNRAYKLFSNLLRNGTTANLWDTHPPFQIDGNFGGVAGITEMLMQSHDGFIHILPALPDCWDKGSVSGLCARGGFEVSIDWQDCALKNIKILSKKGVPCSVRYRDETISFNTKENRVYIIDYEGRRLNIK